jgi:hypothetical protein
MPTWGEILTELNDPANRLPNGTPDFDGIRRKYLSQLFDLTGRSTIIYYTDWFNKGGSAASITLEDMQGMMEVCKDLQGPNLDILLHSPGGSPEAAASIVRYLRTKYFDIRVFVPLAAMSAATMWALAGNRIVMGKHSQLGPIDPQLVAPGWQAPARAILRQFEQAKEECKDPSLLGAWIPILQQYGPAIIQQCEAAEALPFAWSGNGSRSTCSRGTPTLPQKRRRSPDGSRTMRSTSPIRSASIGSRPVARA